MNRPRLPHEPRQRGGGEQVDRAAGDAIKLAHRALERFPDLVRRHRFIAGGAAVSSALVALGGVALAGRMRAGQTAEEAVAEITEQEIETPNAASRARPAAPPTESHSASSNGSPPPNGVPAPAEEPAESRPL